MRLYKDNIEVSSYSSLINNAIIGWVSSSDYNHYENVITKINYTEESVDFTTTKRRIPLGISKEDWIKQFEASLSMDIAFATKEK